MPRYKQYGILSGRSLSLTHFLRDKPRQRASSGGGSEELKMTNISWHGYWTGFSGFTNDSGVSVFCVFGVRVSSDDCHACNPRICNCISCSSFILVEICHGIQAWRFVMGYRRIRNSVTLRRMSLNLERERKYKLYKNKVYAKI